MSQYEATKLFGELVRCADIEVGISVLLDGELRGLHAALSNAERYAQTGVPGMLRALLEVEACNRFLSQGGEA